MSIKFKKALRKGSVKIQCRIVGEVAIIYYDHDGNRRQKQLRGRRVILDIIPRLSPVEFADRSNIEEMVRKGAIRIVD
jgi:hypothetical protein